VIDRVPRGRPFQQLRDVPVLRRAVCRGIGSAWREPDGAYATYIHHDSGAKTTTLYLHPMTGDPPRPLATTHLPETFDNLAEWTPDSKYLIFATSIGTETGTSTYWSHAVSTGERVKIQGLNPKTGATTLRIHPDGRRVAFSMGQQQLQVWTLSNFLPAADAKK